MPRMVTILTLMEKDIDKLLESKIPMSDKMLDDLREARKRVASVHASLEVSSSASVFVLVLIAELSCSARLRPRSTRATTWRR